MYDELTQHAMDDSGLQPALRDRVREYIIKAIKNRKDHLRRRSDSTRKRSKSVDAASGDSEVRHRPAALACANAEAPLLCASIVGARFALKEHHVDARRQPWTHDGRRGRATGAQPPLRSSAGQLQYARSPQRANGVAAFGRRRCVSSRAQVDHALTGSKQTPRRARKSVRDWTRVKKRRPALFFPSARPLCSILPPLLP